MKARRDRPRESPPFGSKSYRLLKILLIQAEKSGALGYDAKMAALFALSHLEPPPACLICRQTAAPAMVGWTYLKRDKTFVICSDCADDDELEAKILAQLSDSRGAEKTLAVGAPGSPIEAVPEAWTARAARD